MNNWRELASEKRWADIEHFWNWPNDAEIATASEMRDLLSAIQQDIPIIEVRNGDEKATRHARPDEIADEHLAGYPNENERAERKRHLRAGALILALGELEAAVEGEPAEPMDEWTEARDQAFRMLEKLSLTADPLPEGHPELSLAKHVETAREFLEHVGVLIRYHIAEADDGHEARFIEQALGELAHTCLSAGIHLRAAVGKESEALAVKMRRSTERIAYDRTGGRAEYNSDRKKDERSGSLLPARQQQGSGKNTQESRHGTLRGLSSAR